MATSEKKKASNLRYYYSHIEQTRMAQKKYYLEHREQARASGKKYQQTHPEKVRASSNKYYNDHRENIRKSQKKYYDTHHEKVLAYQRMNKSRYYKKICKTVFAHYGYRCNCCGETEPLFLEIDHVNGYKSGPRAGLPLYQWLISNNYPEGFQILCSNCNQGKRRNHNVCPHEEK